MFVYMVILSVASVASVASVTPKLKLPVFKQKLKLTVTDATDATLATEEIKVYIQKQLSSLPSLAGRNKHISVFEVVYVC